MGLEYESLARMDTGELARHVDTAWGEIKGTSPADDPEAISQRLNDFDAPFQELVKRVQAGKVSTAGS